MSALCELTGCKTSRPQRTAEMAGCTAAQNLGWLRYTAEFAKGASCALRISDILTTQEVNADPSGLWAEILSQIQPNH